MTSHDGFKLSNAEMECCRRRLEARQYGVLAQWRMMESTIRLRGRSARRKIFRSSHSLRPSSSCSSSHQPQAGHNGSTHSTSFVALVCTPHAIDAFDIIDCIDVVFMADSILLSRSLEAC